MNASAALEIAAAFGVDVSAATALELRGGYSNESWRVAGGAAPVVVRRYGRLHLTRAAVAFEHAVMDHAGARMPEVVRPLRDAGGASTLVHDGRYAAVFPWIAGSTGARDPAAGAAAAQVLARFHRAVRSLHVNGGLRSTRFLGIMPWLIESFKRFAEAGSPVARALPWNDLLVAVSASVARIAPTATRLPHVILHGDPNPGNVVMEGGAVRGLIDFDFAHESERITDVGVLLDEFGRADDDAALDVGRLPALVAAYADAAPLAADERALIPDAMLRHAATLVSYVVTRHGERVPGDVGGAPRYARRVLEIARCVETIRRAR